MRRELQAYLDGEIGRDQLPAELHEEADRWAGLLASMRSLDPQGAPVGLDATVLRSLRRRRAEPAWRRGLQWATRPRTVRVSPLAGLAAAAAIAFLIVIGRGERQTPQQSAPETTVFVQFTLEAPLATSVAIAGDFNAWQPEIYLEDPDGDGVWTGRIPMRPGIHHYMFVIDGSEWKTDPRAERYADDGFGNRNAVLVVTRPTSQS